MDDEANWELVKMDRCHLDDVAAIDSQCYTNSLSKSVFRKAVRESACSCWVIESSGLVIGFMVAVEADGDMTIDRIGFRRSGAANVVRALMSWACFCCEEKGIERVRLYASEDQLVLRSIMNGLGFYAFRLSTAPRGESSKQKSVLVKQMRESTWLEKTHYPEGDRVIEEILNGEGRVLT